MTRYLLEYLADNKAKLDMEGKFNPPFGQGSGMIEHKKSSAVLLFNDKGELALQLRTPTVNKA